MKLIINGRHAHVTLSVRNLMDLLAQAQSEVTPGYGTLVRGSSADDNVLSVNIEPDGVHYADRDPGEGSGLLAPVAYPRWVPVESPRWEARPGRELAERILEGSPLRGRLIGR